MTTPSECPRCQGHMTEGFTLDNTYGGRVPASWVPGQPQKSFWVGVTIGGAKPIEIATWRCTRCGYLESYAPADPA